MSVSAWRGRDGERDIRSARRIARESVKSEAFGNLTINRAVSLVWKRNGAQFDFTCAKAVCTRTT